MPSPPQPSPGAAASPRRVLLAATAVLAGLLATAAAPRAESPTPQRLVLATGGVAGVYFPLGSVLAEVWSAGIAGLEVEAEPTAGSIANLGMIEEGEAHLALVQTDIAHYAREGEEMFADAGPLEGFAAVAVLYPEAIQVVTRADAGIAAIGDLAGQRVAVGARGSGTEANARQILEVHGLGYDDIGAAFLDFAEAATALGDGMIAAAFVTAGTPTAAVAELPTTYRQPIALVPLGAAETALITERWPFYAPYTVPAHTYAGLEQAVPTVAVRAMLVASTALEAETVAALVELLFADPTLARLCRTHPRGCDIDPDAALEALPVPLHPGAAQALTGGG